VRSGEKIICRNKITFPKPEPASRQPDAHSVQGDLMTFRPSQDRVLIRLIAPEEKTAGGICILDIAG
jgi:hypothetical protein